MIKFIHFEDTFKPEWQDFVKVGDIVEANSIGCNSRL